MSVQLPVSADGVLTGLLGGQSAGGQGIPAGLQGLFATLLGDATPEVGAIAPIAPTEGDGVLQGLLSKLKDLEVSVESLKTAQKDIKDLQSFLKNLQATLQSLQQAGVQQDDVSGTAGLSEIFQKLGMSSEVADKNAKILEDAIVAIGEKEANGELASLLQSVAPVAPVQNTLESTTTLTGQPSEFLLEELQQNTDASRVRLDVFAKTENSSPVADVPQRALQGKELVPALQGKPISRLSDNEVKNVLSPKDIAENPVTKLIEDAPKVALKTVTSDKNFTSKIAGETIAPEAVKQTSEDKLVDVKTPEPKAPVLPLDKEITLQNVNTEQGYSSVRKLQPTHRPEPVHGKEIFKWDTTKHGVDILTKTKAGAEILVAKESANVEGSGDTQAKAGAGSTFASRLNHFARVAHIGTQAQPMLKALAQDGGGKVSFSLHPKELGRIEISLKIKEGKVSGVIAAQHSQVVSQLARELQHLKQGLEDAGFQLGEDGMAFLLQEDSGNGQQYEGQKEGSYTGAEKPDGNDELEIAEKAKSENWVSPDQLLNVTV